MSLSHVRLVRSTKGSDEVDYKVQSTDFDTEGKWADIGRLKLLVKTDDYLFEALLPISARKFLPPSIYKLPEAERQRLLATDFKDFGWGAWAMTIHHYAVTLLRNGEFPEHHP
jgi:hypothetical protein